MGGRGWAAIAGLAILTACTRPDATPPQASAPPSAKPSILLVTLDTTRADAVGPESTRSRTPAFNALAARGRRFRQAYATVPETLPSHVSMLTGLYPGGHGIHENGRTLPAIHPVAAEKLKQGGYQTAAFVSSFVLARRFGLARGFDTYDDELPDGSERTALDTTERAVRYLDRAGDQPLFLWVHYFDPHAPYAPPEPFRRTFERRPYDGEIAAMDEQLGRLVQRFEDRARGRAAIVVAGDHGEGLGDHGEGQHGNLLYQSTMHVPLVVVDAKAPPVTVDAPVSTRRVFHTLLDLAGLQSSDSLRTASAEVVLGEAMKPYLEYGWQPQTMAVAGTRKAILAGRLDAYDLAADPSEQRSLGSGANLPPGLRKALEDYPIPALDRARTPETLGDEARQRLASLGYVGATAAPVVRKDAPRPADMVHLFDLLEKASGLFVQARYADVIPLLEGILDQDPHNLDAVLRLATAHSMLGHEAQAVAAFRRAAALAPASADVRMYLALHRARGRQWKQAIPTLEAMAADRPPRLPVLEALVSIRERQQRYADAIALRQRVYEMRTPDAAELSSLAILAMNAQQTPLAIESFERARGIQGGAFRRDLELGVLYLAAHRYREAAEALDRVPSSHPERAMVLFKRAQVSVLLKEADQTARIARARAHADRTTRELIARERLFQSSPR